MNADELMIKKALGLLTPSEKEWLDNWLQLHPNDREKTVRYEEAWETLKVPDMPAFDMDESWAHFKGLLNEKEAVGLRSKKMKQFSFRLHRLQTLSVRHRRIWAPSFLLIIVFLIGGLWLWNIHTETANVVQTQNKENVTARLPDGSSVHVNYASRLVYKETESERRVSLKGEAFFTVTHTRKPFVVSTEHASIRVLGTEFNVRERGKDTRVVVRKGTVSLTSSQEQVILQANQSGRVDSTKVPQGPFHANLKHDLAWMEGRLVFERMPLSEVAAELERAYDIRVHIQSKELAQRKITATFEHVDVQSLLSSLGLILNASWQRVSESQYELQPRE